MGWLKCGVNFLFVFFCFHQAFARIHNLRIENDRRKNIRLSTFGFFKNGILDVNIFGFHAEGGKPNDVFGFSLERAMNEAMDSYIDLHREKCLLEDSLSQQSASSSAAAFFVMDFKNKQLIVNCSDEFTYLPIFVNASEINNGRAKRDSFSDMSLMGHQKILPHDRQKAVWKREMKASNQTCKGLQQKIPITALDNGRFSTSFAILIAQNKEEGLYNLYFHNCPNYGEERVTIDFTIKIEERNEDNFLSAGEMPLPALFFMMSILFFLSGCFWVFILVKSKHTVFKIHYLMAILVYLKSLSLLFHAINYHFIQTRGEHVAAWAILYYITHLLKGSVLFITIILIGTGWNFIKPLLSNRDKKIFMIVIPLQVLANVANVIIEESEEGDAEHKTWADVFMLVDLLCCGAILFPVVWSIRHLQEASHTDGKAAINLRKLKLFRHFYIMVVGYIYFTRIIVYLLQMTVSFKYKYLDDMFREMVTYVFYVLTGYKFRPASPNPYFQVNNDDDDDPEMDTVVTQCGVTEGLSKLSRINKEEIVEEEKESLLFAKRESSHEYD